MIHSVIRVASPSRIVRATIPFAPGTTWDPDASPLTVFSGSTALPTQCERVARWPDGSLRIAELLAVCDSPQSVLDVHDVSTADLGRAKPGPWAEKWRDSPPIINIDGTRRTIAWVDKFHRKGSVAVTRRFWGRNIMGWVTVYDGLDVVTLDLVLHNGEPGSADFFFDSIEMIAPSGEVHAESAWPVPGMSHMAGRVRLVDARTDGYAHGLVQRGSHYWSLTLHDGSQSTLARAMADGAGFGVSSAWTSVDAYGAAALCLPDLAYRHSSLVGSLRAEWDQFSRALTAGTPVGMVSGGLGRVDWQHPWNPKDGGTTGGGFRRQWHGVELASCGDPVGLLLMQARLATIMDRHAVLALERNGSPMPYEKKIDANDQPLGNWRSSSADARFDGTSDGAWGWQARWNENAGPRTPPELALFKQRIAGAGNSNAFEPIDFQHWDRALQDAEALVQLSNSPVAAWWLRCNAETWRMSLFSGDRLKGELAKARNRSAWGTSWGRAHGHGMRVASMAYAISGDTWRTRWDTFLGHCAEIMVTAQMPSCLFRRDEHSKAIGYAPFNGQYGLTKGTEEALLANGALGLARSAGKWRAELVVAVDHWSSSGLWTWLWNSGATGSSPSDYIAVALLGQAPYDDPTTILRLNGDREEVASPLGSAMLLAGGAFTSEQSLAAKRWCGGSLDPLGWLKSRSLYQLKLDDCAPLHAALK